MFKLSFIACLILCTYSVCASSEYEKVIMKIARDAQLRKDFKNNLHYLMSIEPNYLNYTVGAQFECETDIFPDETPTSVHKLTPKDINLVAALGDSITAGVGIQALTPVGLLRENRERSWSIGGHKTLESVLTIPNILKKYNPSVKGFATHSTFAIGKETNAYDLAISGAKAIDIPSQAENLVRKLKADKHVDFENDWKLVTLFIGGNDLCQICKRNNEMRSPENYIAKIREGLDILHRELPRTFVNLVGILNIEDIKYMNKGLACPLLHEAMCKCAAFPSKKYSTEVLIEYTKNYQKLTSELVSSGRYDTRDDFTVVHQPFFRDFEAPKKSNGEVDLSYFAPDCFHFSAKAHNLGARGLWNNMLQKVGMKDTTLELDEKLICPTKEHPYFYTNKNRNA